MFDIYRDLLEGLSIVVEDVGEVSKLDKDKILHLIRQTKNNEHINEQGKILVDFLGREAASALDYYPDDNIYPILSILRAVIQLDKAIEQDEVLPSIKATDLSDGTKQIIETEQETGAKIDEKTESRIIEPYPELKKPREVNTHHYKMFPGVEPIMLYKGQRIYPPILDHLKKELPIKFNKKTFNKVMTKYFKEFHPDRKIAEKSLRVYSTAYYNYMIEVEHSVIEKREGQEIWCTLKSTFKSEPKEEKVKLGKINKLETYVLDWIEKNTGTDVIDANNIYRNKLGGYGEQTFSRDAIYATLKTFEGKGLVKEINDYKFIVYRTKLSRT